MNKLKVQLWVTRALLVVTGVVSVSYVALAYSNFSSSGPKVVVEGNYIEAGTPAQTEAAPTFGAVASPNQGNLSCFNGDCEYHITQTFIDASTTIVSIPDPFLAGTTTASDVIINSDAGLTGATSTVSLSRLYVTGAATTSMTIACGSAASQTVAAPSVSLVSSALLPTSTVGIVENNVTKALGGTVDGGTVAKIMVGPLTPYFNCVVTPTVSGGVTNPNNTFDGKIIVRFARQQF